MTVTRKTARRFINKVLPLALIALSSVGWGADFPERIAAEARSLAVGFDTDEAPLLHRLLGPGREAVADRLLQRFAASNDIVNTRGRFTRAVGKDRIEVIGQDGWFLQVYNDGSKIRYRNYRYLDDNPQVVRPVKQRMSQDELAARGRYFVATQLADIIKLNPGEEMIPFFTEFEVDGGGVAKEGAPLDPEMVRSAVVVFTRSVRGLHVVGPGSKVAVMLAADGTVIGFDVDWPEYKATGRQQQILPLPALQVRMRQLASLDTGRADVSMERFYCGLVDLGARKRDTNAPIQAGCMVQISQRRIIDPNLNAAAERAGHITVAALDFIPAGKQIEPDSRWPQVQRLLIGAPARSKQPAPGDGPRPPQP